MIGAVGKDNGREEDVERMIEINKLMDLLIKKGAKVTISKKISCTHVYLFS